MESDSGDQTDSMQQIFYIRLSVEHISGTDDRRDQDSTYVDYEQNAEILEICLSCAKQIAKPDCSFDENLQYIILLLRLIDCFFLVDVFLDEGLCMSILKS